MFFLYVAAFFIAIKSTILAVTIPQEEAQLKASISDARVNQFLYLKAAAGEYFRANPLATGVVTSAQLTPYLPRGGITNSDVQSQINSGQLYTYTLSPAEPINLKSLGELTNCSELSGLTLTGSAYRPSCIQVGTGSAIIPSFVPVGSLVSIGK
jgi:hypothetical protein